mmetsp:Transcript_17332/g.54131  ORF Transcript_17332/g.54131 Transcript_17332/m.54131 type:complete len:288 (-) Transcript_17332:1056-1919(-)
MGQGRRPVKRELHVWRRQGPGDLIRRPATDARNELHDGDDRVVDVHRGVRRRPPGRRRLDVQRHPDVVAGRADARGDGRQPGAHELRQLHDRPLVAQGRDGLHDRQPRRRPAPRRRRGGPRPLGGRGPAPRARRQQRDGLQPRLPALQRLDPGHQALRDELLRHDGGADEGAHERADGQADRAALVHHLADGLADRRAHGRTHAQADAHDDDASGAAAPAGARALLRDALRLRHRARDPGHQERGDTGPGPVHGVDRFHDVELHGHLQPDVEGRADEAAAVHDRAFF